MTITIARASDSMLLLGYAIITSDAGGDTIYGVFDTMEEAMQYGSKLTNAVGVPIYNPTLH